MTINGNKHLVSVGHEFAATLTADTPIIEIAKLVTRLATALDVQTALVAQLTEQRDAVVAESAALLTPENWLMHSEAGNTAVAITDGNGASEEAALLAGMKAIIACIETPATSSAIAALRAEGVEMAMEGAKLEIASEFQRQTFEQCISATIKYPQSDMAGKVEMVACMELFARQLRESKGAQS